MLTVEFTLDEALLESADRRAKVERINRSTLLQNALRDYLDRQELRDRERRDAAGYAAKPDNSADLLGWEQVIAWPED